MAACLGHKFEPLAIFFTPIITKVHPNGGIVQGVFAGVDDNGASYG